MSELRYDSLRGRWVNVNPGRAARPTDLDSATKDPSCPFCSGNESRTPPETLATRPDGSAPDTPGWLQRVVPNDFPAVSPSAPATRTARDGLLALSGFGAHEVLIESTDHDAAFGGFDADEMHAVLCVARARLRQLETDARHAYAFWFRNTGRAAGASMAHPHSQLLATPMLPDLVRRRLILAVEHFHQTDEPLAQTTIDRELRLGERIVHANDGAVTMTPYASAYPYEMIIHPRVTTPCFTEADDAAVSGVARALGDAVRRLEALHGTVAYNVVLQTAPNLNAPAAFRSVADPRTVRAAYGWHVEVVPRMPRIDGFEFSVGLLINPVTPERAAGELRSARPHDGRRTE